MADRFEKICDRVIEAGWLIIIFVIPLLVTYPLTYNAYQLPRAAVFMMIVELMLLAYLAKIFKSGKVEFKLSNGMALAIGFFIFANFLSLYFSAHPFKSWQGSYLRQEGVYLFLHYIIFFLLVLSNLKEWRQIRRLLWAIVFSSALITLYGLAEYFNLSFTAWQNSPTKGRIFSTFGQTNFFSHYLIFVLPLAIYSLVKLSRNNLARFGIALLVIGQLFCLVSAFSRAAWLAFGAETFLAFIWLGYQLRKRVLSGKKIKIIAGASALVVIFIAIFFGNNWNFVANRIRSGSIQSRLYYWQAAVDGIKEFPLKRLAVGLGQENQTDIFVRAYRPEWSFYETINTYPDRAHNVLFDIILETGLFGLASAAFFFLSVIFSGFKFLMKVKADPTAADGRDGWLMAVLAMIVVGSFVNNLFSFSTVATNVYLYLVLALIVAIISFEKEGRIVEIRLHSVSKILIFSSFAFLSSVSILLYNIKPLIADHYYNQAKLAGRDCFGIYRNLNEAVNWQPDGSHYLDQYLFYGLNCLNDQTKKDKDFAIRLNIENILRMSESYKYIYSLNFNFAHAFAMLGFYYDRRYYDLAEKKYEELEKINPYFTSLYRDWGRLRLWQGKYDGAEEVLKKGEKILIGLRNDPRILIGENFSHKQKIETELSNFNYNLGEVNFYKHNWDEAIRYYREELRLNPYELDAYQKLGDIYLEQKKYDSAIRSYQRGRSLEPNNFIWPLDISIIYKEQKNKEQALKYAEIASRISPEDERIKKVSAEIKEL